MACEILVLWPGIETVFPALIKWSLNHWTARKVPTWISFKTFSVFFCCCCCFLPCPGTSGILVPWPGLKPPAHSSESAECQPLDHQGIPLPGYLSGFVLVTWGHHQCALNTEGFLLSLILLLVHGMLVPLRVVLVKRRCHLSCHNQPSMLSCLHIPKSQAIKCMEFPIVLYTWLADNGCHRSPMD